MRFGLLTWLMLGTVLFPVGGSAQEIPTALLTESAFTEGKRLFTAGDYSAAYSRFLEAYRAMPENLDANFYLGRSAFEAGDYESAIMAFEGLLIMAPDADRVKLELARSYLKIGSRNIAREYFKSVQATNPPAAVWQQIQLFLDSIDAAERRHFINGFVALSGLYDSNVGAAPKLDTLIIGGLTVLLDQREESDLGLNATMVLNHLYRFLDTPYTWKSTFTSYNNWFEEQNDYNLNLFALNTGLLRQDEKGLWEIQALGNLVNVDDHRYLGVAGLNLSHTRFLSRQLSLSLGGAFQDKTYYRNRERNAHTWTISANPVYSTQKDRVSLVAALETEDAARDSYDYRRAIGSLRYDRQLPFDVAVYLGLRFHQTDYRADDPFFRKERADKQSIWETGISKTLWRAADRGQALVGQISFTRTDNRSNIDLYDYRKHVGMSTLTFAF